MRMMKDMNDSLEVKGLTECYRFRAAAGGLAMLSSSDIVCKKIMEVRSSCPSVYLSVCLPPSFPLSLPPSPLPPPLSLSLSLSLSQSTSDFAEMIVFAVCDFFLIHFSFSS